MTNPPSALCLPRVAAASRQHLIDAFWAFSTKTHKQKESERLQQTKSGVSAELVAATRSTFNLEDDHLALLFNASPATLRRRLHQQKPLDSVASERLDRITSVCLQAEAVFESRAEAAHWMSKSNAALGHGTPVLLCLTEIGANQVRRVLHALESGGAA